MLDPFLALDPLKNPRNFIGTLRWDQDGNRAALDLLGRIAKNPLALGFQLRIMPSNVMPMMASWADSTIDASWEVAARTCLCSLMIERARNAVKERTYSWLLYTELDTVDHSKT